MRNPHPAPPARDDADDAPSKTKRKHEMLALQTLGVELVTLDPRRLAALDLPEQLRDAIALARTITRHEARRRQMQYIGRLMRDIDAAPIRAALAAWARGPQHERARFAQIERWRERVLREPDGVQAFADVYPHAPLDVLTALAAAARDEDARGAPPHRSRALFRELKRIIDEAS